MKYYYNRKPNYGALTDLSKAMNEVLGDDSGRTVSTRTAHGFKSVFNSLDMGENEAEDIVHAGIGAAGLLLASKNEGAQAAGALLSFILLICYHSGK